MYQVLVHDDCMEALKAIPDASVDAVVTDPPYDLTDGKSGKGFMGKAWDGTGIAFSVPLWREVLRVLKPGGYILSFGGTRTYHRMTCAIEDAGADIRDCILAWKYGSGFPKSLDVSKAIDKAGGTSPAVTAQWLRTEREAAGLSRAQVAERVGCTEASVRDWEEGRARAEGKPVEFIVPSDDYRARLTDLFNYCRDNREVVGSDVDRRGDGTVYGVGLSGTLRSGGHSSAAKAWTGWGTALKPAWEPVVVARKPLEGTVAANVLKYGTGAMNIDASRVPTSDNLNGGAYSEGTDRPDGTESWRFRRDGSAGDFVQPTGRWPANILLTHAPDCSDEGCVEGCPCAALDAQSGGDGASRYFNRLPIEEDDLVPFFYTPKASRSEREAGCEALASEVVERTGMAGRGQGGMKCRTCGKWKASGSPCVCPEPDFEKVAFDRPPVANQHPCVKPISIMEWCIRLVAREGAVVLDPFMGSGTTGIAAVRCKVNFIGIEREEEYLRIAEARIRHHGGDPEKA